MVEAALNELTQQQHQTTSTDEEDENSDDPTVGHESTLENVTTAHMTAMAELLETVRNIDGWRARDLVELVTSTTDTGTPCAGITEWLGNVFPPVDPIPRRINTPLVNPSRSQRRRRDYARIQKLWYRSMSGAVREVLAEGAVVGDVSFEEFVRHWGAFVTQPSIAVDEDPGWVLNPGMNHIWAPVTREEIERAKLPLRSAPGPDRLTVRQWRAVPISVRALVYNKIMSDGGFPAAMLSSRTVFLPKELDGTKPSNYRPISITSVVVRELNKILANRVRAAKIIDSRQRYFEDGCLENVATLSAALYRSRTRLEELHVVSLDVTKAFDSVSHQAIEVALSKRGFPRPFIEYVMNMYNSSTTYFEHRQQSSALYKLGRGVRQGDPLSPILFCIVVDDLLASIPQDVGFNIEGVKVNSIAYADDIVLLTSTKWGMETSLGRLEAAAAKYGLSFNSKKSNALSLVPSGRQKKMKVVTEPQFALGEGEVIPQISSTATWKYLGVDFSCMGVSKTSRDLQALLERVTRAPLKPQQRLKILRTFLIPKLYHGLVLSGTTVKKLRQLDLQSRAAVRRWLRLPHDTAKGFFHATVADGGLGIPALETSIPALIYDRLSRLATSNVPVSAAVGSSEWATKRMAWALRLVKRNGVDLSTKRRRDCFWREKLYGSVDGNELKECHKSTLSTSWVERGAHRIPGRDYVQYVHTRINSLPTAVRVSRGDRRGSRDVKCRAGCMVTETAAHVIQNCHRTHGGRVLRHNAVCHVLAAGLRRAGWSVEEEPTIPTREGNRKPDLVCYKDEEATVIDTQVISAVQSLNESHQKKRNYYAKNPDVPPKLVEKLGIDPRKLAFTSCTISWRGVWASKSEEDLLRMGLKKSLLASITTRVLQGSHTNWSRFNRMTSMRKRNPAREGIG